MSQAQHTVRQIRCPNCGTEWAPQEPLTTSGSDSDWGYTCPVCQYHVSATPEAPQEALTGAELQARLAELLTLARTSGLSSEEIVNIMRDELEFEAELSTPGRRMLVQIIDLGTIEPEITVVAAVRRQDTVRGRLAR